MFAYVAPVSVMAWRIDLFEAMLLTRPDRLRALLREGVTVQRTNGHTLLQRCVGASSNGIYYEPTILRYHPASENINFLL